MYTFNLFLSILILGLFYLISSKQKFDELERSTFECGFRRYFFSRFSFSVHFYVVAIIFLFLDLEICFIIPFIVSEESKWAVNFCIFLFLITLLGGLIEEWIEGKLEWKF